MKRPISVGYTRYTGMTENEREQVLITVQRYISDQMALARSYSVDAERALADLVKARNETDAVTGGALNTETVRWVMARRDKAATTLNNAVYRLTQVENEIERQREYAALYVDWDADIAEAEKTK